MCRVPTMRHDVTVRTNETLVCILHIWMPKHHSNKENDIGIFNTRYEEQKI